MKSYAEIIRGLREDNDLKQIDIANILGTTQQHYSKYETEEYELPLRALVALADYYKLSTDFLLGRTDCREGVAGLNKNVSRECTIGALISDVLSLDAVGRAAVIDYVSLRTTKMAWDKMKAQREKDSKRG